MRLTIIVAIVLMVVPVQGEGGQPRLTVTGVGKQRAALPLTRLVVEAKVLGPVAETRMTMTFFNNQSRALECELSFPLPAGAFASTRCRRDRT